MYTVKRAIIMAAGEGKRLRPVTAATPKPLVRVHGVRLIDTIIHALHVNGIREIYIVVGYLKEQFASLEREYPGVRLIENPYFDSCNNISSLYAARDYIRDAIILDGDQLVYDPDVLSPPFERSGYNAVWTDGWTDEWLLTVRDGIVTGCSREGGRGGWQLYSISRWSEEDGRRLCRHLEEEFEGNGQRGIYWDDVALFSHPSEYRLGIRPMRRGAVVEIDGLAELARLDSAYAEYVKEAERDEG